MRTKQWIGQAGNANHFAENLRRSHTLWCLLVSFVGLLGAVVIVTTEAPARARDEHRLNTLVREFSERLGIPEPVSISYAEANDRLVSVRGRTEPAEGFLIELDQQFAATLTQEELRAVLAHELGHVWIFTHHPYLQTEPLANEKALEVVGRRSLERAYQKVWLHQGQKGTLEEFLGTVESR